MVDKFLAWLNVRIENFQKVYESTQDKNMKRDLKHMIIELKIVRNSYFRNRENTNG